MSSTNTDSDPPCAKRARTMASGETLALGLATESIQQPSTQNSTRTASTSGDDSTSADSHHLPTQQLPLAPRIQEYLAPGEGTKYRPRPEWLTPTTTPVPRLRRGVSTWLPYANTGLMMDTVVDLTTPTVYEEEGDDTNNIVGVARAAAAPLSPEQNTVSSSTAHNINNSHNPLSINNGLLPDDAFASFALNSPSSSSLARQSETLVERPTRQHPPAQRTTGAPRASIMHPSFSVNSHPTTPTAAVERVFLTPPSSIAPPEIPEHSPSSSLSHVPSCCAAIRPRNLALTTFGQEQDSALHMAIKGGATDAALALLQTGAPIDRENAKGATPMILAAQRGNLQVVQALMELGASPSGLSSSSALIQAAHFGRQDVITLLLSDDRWKSLVDAPNLNQTTALMRAAQEGHLEIVRELLKAGADPNKRNRLQMTALMLASQRGEASIVQLLIDKGAHVNARTKQDSTSLLLASKRGHKEVVQVLMTAGCELWIRDSRGRTAKAVAQKRLRDITVRRQRQQQEIPSVDLLGDGTKEREIIAMLDSAVQVHMLQIESRKLRSLEIAKLWKLLQEGRASAKYSHGFNDVTTPNSPTDTNACCSSSILTEAMSLPANIVELIASFMPLPHLWQKRISMLTHRATSHPDAAVISALDMIDEILEEGGFLEACGAARVVPPTNFTSWQEWKKRAQNCGITSSCLKPRAATSITGLEDESERPIVTLATADLPLHFDQSDPMPSRSEMRRRAGFLSILAHRTPLLQLVLSQPPYNVPERLLSQMIRISDLSSLVRRMGSRGVHFDSQVAMELVMLASSLCTWYWREDKAMSTSLPILRTPV